MLALIAQAEEESGNQLVSPVVGVMIWTLIIFGLTLIILWSVPAWAPSAPASASASSSARSSSR